MRLVERQFERLLVFGATRTHWDVLFGYIPFPDEFLHLWSGYLDPSLPGHDAALAARLRPFLDEGLRIADEYVGALARTPMPRPWWPWAPTTARSLCARASG